MTKNTIFKSFALAIAMLPLLASAAPPCMPGLYGTQVGNADYARTNDGWHGHFFCRDASGRVTGHVFACVHGSCLPLGTFVDRVTSMKRGANPVQTLQAAWDAEFGNKCETATGALKTVCDQAYAAARANFPSDTPAPPPPPPPPLAEVWEIAPTTSGQRPSRKVAEGQLVTMSSPVYLPVGTACDSAATPSFITTAGTWMAVAGQAADLRWLCRRK